MLRREWDPTIPHAIQPCAADPDRVNVDFGKDLNLSKQSRSKFKVFWLHLLFQKSDNVFQESNSVYEGGCSRGPDMKKIRREDPFASCAGGPSYLVNVKILKNTTSGTTSFFFPRHVTHARSDTQKSV
jgi:hypothetical protein